MIKLNLSIIIVGIAAILVDDVNTVAVAYIYRRDNGGAPRVIQVGKGPLPFTLPHQIGEPWKLEAFEAYKLKPKANTISKSVPAKEVVYKDSINGIAKLVDEAVKKNFFAALPLVQPWTISDDVLNRKSLQPDNFGISKNIENQDGKHNKRISNKYVVKSFVTHDYGDSQKKKIPKNSNKIHPVYEETDEIYSNYEKHLSHNNIQIPQKGVNLSIDKGKNVPLKAEIKHNDSKQPVIHHKNSHERTTGKACKTNRGKHSDSEEQTKSTQDKDKKNHGKKLLHNVDYYDKKQNFYNTLPYYKIGRFGDKDFSIYEDKPSFKIDYSPNFDNIYLDRNKNYNIKDYYGKEGFYNDKKDENKVSNTFKNYDGLEEKSNKQEGKQNKQNRNQGQKNFVFVNEWKNGYNEQWNRDEYKKDHDFYDDADKTGWNRKGNKVNIHNEYKKGSRNEGGNYGSTSDETKYGSGHSHGERTIDDESDHKYSAKKGDEIEYKDNKEYKKNVGDDSGKKYGYEHEED